MSLPQHISLYDDYMKYHLPAQAQENSNCWAYSVIGALELELSRDTGQTVRLSGRYLTWAASEDDRLSVDRQGNNFGRAARALGRFGVCPLELYASDGVKVTPEVVSRAKALGTGIVIDWVRFYRAPSGLSEEEMAYAKSLLAKGHPLAIGMKWPNNVKVAAPDLCLLGECSESEVFDGHCVTVVGYEDDARYPGGGAFMIRNTWGPDWLRSGFGRMSYSYFRSYANDMLSFHVDRSDPRSIKPEVELTNRSAGVRDLKPSDCLDATVTVAGDNISRYGANLWQNDDQVFFPAKQANSSFKVALDVPRTGKYRLQVAGTTAPDYGTYRFRIGRKPVGRDIDFCSVSIMPTGTLDLGTVECRRGKAVLTVQCIGKSFASRGYYLGLDWVCLKPVTD